MSGEVALEAADRFAWCFAFAGAARDVGDRVRVAFAAGEQDRVWCAVELVVAGGSALLDRHVVAPAAFEWANAALL